MKELSLSLSNVDVPKGKERLSNIEILMGKPITDIDRIRIMSEDEYEDFILEWVHGYLQENYHQVVQLGGAGDKGRDIIGYVDEAKNICDYYQCKHYESPLTPSDIYVEIGKIIYFCFKKEIPVPREYFFVAPKGEGPTLHDLLRNSIDLKKALLSNWTNHCNFKEAGVLIKLEGSLLKFINSFDFSIFKSKQPLDVIAEHGLTKYHAARFGGGLKRTRTNIPSATKDIQHFELNYTNQLFEVYSEKEEKPFKQKDDLKPFSELYEHFNESRNSFYCAESLNQFSRDNFPNHIDAFREFKDEVYATIKNVLMQNHINGFSRLLNSTQVAINNQYISNPLFVEIKSQDKEGTCHHLANENKIKWVKK